MSSKQDNSCDVKEEETAEDEVQPSTLHQQHPPPPSASRKITRRYPLPCRYVGCTRVASTRRDFTFHDRTHSGRKPYRCTYGATCDHASAQKIGLITHIRKKHFNLPASVAEQAKYGISDDRDANQYVKTRHRVLEEERLELEAYLGSGADANNTEQVVEKQSEDDDELASSESTSSSSEDEDSSSSSSSSDSESSETSEPAAPSTSATDVLDRLTIHQPSTRHSRILRHLGQLTCPVEQCHQEFASYSSLAEHYRSHSERTPYQCIYRPSECTFEAGTKLAIIEHVREMHIQSKAEEAEAFTADPLKYITVRQEVINEEEEILKQLLRFSIKEKEEEEPRRRMRKKGRKDHSNLPFTCKYKPCDAAFTNVYNLRHHERTHSDIKPYLCRFDPITCHFASAQKGHVIHHIRTAHMNLPSTQREQMQRGITSEQEPALFIETLQYLLAEEETELLRRFPAVSFNTRPRKGEEVVVIKKKKKKKRQSPSLKGHFRCRLCGNVLIGKQNAVRHVRQMHYGIARQDQIGMSIESDDAVEQLQAVERDLAEEDEEEDEQNLAEPGFKDSAKRATSKQRQRIKTDESSDESEDEQSISHRASSRSAAAGSSYICRFDNCRKSFNDFLRLRQHDRTHTGIKPFICSYNQQFCRKACAIKSNLISHIRRVHLPPEKAHRASRYIKTRQRLLDCEERLIRASQKSKLEEVAGTVEEMKEEEKEVVHSESNSDDDDENPATTASGYSFSCRHFNCDRQFSTLNKLKAHDRTHTGCRPYHCTYPSCSHTATIRSNLIIHIRRAHFNLPPSMLEQEKLGIVDDRDANEFVYEDDRQLREEDRNIKGWLKRATARQNIAAVSVSSNTPGPSRGGGEDAQDDSNDESSDNDEWLNNHRQHNNSKSRRKKKKKKKSASTKQLSTTTNHEYICLFESCKRSFTNLSKLKAHDRYHRNVKPYICYYEQCRHQLSTKANLVQHIEVKHFGWPATLHERMVQGIKVKKSKAKRYIVTLYDQLEEEAIRFAAMGYGSTRSFRSRPSVRPFACLLCDEQFRGFSSAVRHVRVVHFHLEEAVVDGLELEDDDYRALRMVVEWKGEADEEAVKSEADDSFSEIDFASDDEYEDYGEMMETDQQPQQEEEKEEPQPEPAKQVEPSSESSDYTSDTDSDSEPKAYHCTDANCNASFRTSAELLIHNRIHLDLFPYHCIYPSAPKPCTFVTYSKAKAIRHIRLMHFHLPPKEREQRKYNIKDDRDPLPYIKTDENALKGQPKADLKPNAKRSDEKPIIACRFNRYGACNWFFTSNRVCRRHEQFHLVQEPFRCGICIVYRRFKWGKVYKHIRTKHFGLPPIRSDDTEDDEGEVEEARKKFIINETFLP